VPPGQAVEEETFANIGRAADDQLMPDVAVFLAIGLTGIHLRIGFHVESDLLQCLYHVLNWDMRFRRWLPWLLAGVYYLAAALAATWPLVLDMRNAEIGWIGDNYYFTWLIMWTRRALFNLHCSPLFVPFVNYPQGASPDNTNDRMTAQLYPNTLL